MPYLEDGVCAVFDRVGWNLNFGHYKIATIFFKKHRLFPKLDMGKGSRATTLGAMLWSKFNILMSDGPEWKKHNKIVGGAFSLALPVELFGEKTESLLKIFDTNFTNVDIYDLMQRLTLDIIGKAAFDFDFKALTEVDSEWVKTFNLFTAGAREPLFELFPFLDKYFLSFFPHRKAAREAAIRFLELVKGVIEDRCQKLENEPSTESEHKKDLLTLMIESGKKEEKYALTKEELQGNVQIFFLAGHHTTAAALSFTLYYLAKNPDKQEELYEEAVEILGEGPETVHPTKEQITKLYRHEATMWEVLRLNPSAPATLPRFTTEEINYGNITIPKGTNVVINIHEIHHNPDIWENPEEFKPERFLTNEGKLEDLNKFPGLVPFSSGSRQCLGKKFAIFEFKTVLAMLVKKYRVSLPEGSPHEKYVITSGNLGVVEPIDLRINFTKRH